MQGRGRPGLKSHTGTILPRKRVAAFYRKQARANRRAQGRIFKSTKQTDELKFLDTSITDASISGACTFTDLNVIVQDDLPNGRDGRKVVVSSIHVKGFVKLRAATAATDTSGTVRCMLIQDKQTNGATMTAAQLLTSDAYNSFRNLNNSKRFKILWKEEYDLKAGGAAPSGAALVFSEDIQHINANVKCNIPLTFDQTAATGAKNTQTENSIYWVTQSGEAASEVAAIEGTARIRFRG